MPHEPHPRHSGRDVAAPSGTLTDALMAIGGDVAENLTLMEAMLASDGPPERGALSSLRLQFSQSLERHFKFVREHVVPALTASGTQLADDAACDVSRALQAYHQEAAHHVAAWPTVKAFDEWDGYRRSVDAMFGRLHRLLELERSQVHPRLAAVERASR